MREREGRGAGVLLGVLLGGSFFLPSRQHDASPTRITHRRRKLYSERSALDAHGGAFTTLPPVLVPRHLPLFPPLASDARNGNVRGLPMALWRISPVRGSMVAGPSANTSSTSTAHVMELNLRRRAETHRWFNTTTAVLRCWATGRQPCFEPSYDTPAAVAQGPAKRQGAVAFLTYLMSPGS